ncbi:MAG: DUF3369 domain-containing protein [Magnetococcus sp. MYC-9]
MMNKKIIRGGNKKSNGQAVVAANPWRLLVVDDEPDLLTMTEISLSEFQFDGRSLEIVKANSGEQARQILATDSEFAVAIIDVVMERPDAGLQLVMHIRNMLRNSTMRLIIRTGQPGMAPEKAVIDEYDIDDYKEKTELTQWKLYSTVRTAIKSYRDLMVIESNRLGLARILEAAPELYRHRSLEQFSRAVLCQLSVLLPSNCNGFVMSAFEDITAAIHESSADNMQRVLESAQVNCGLGCYETDDALRETALRQCIITLQARHDCRSWTADALGYLVAPLVAHGHVFGIVYLELSRPLTGVDQQILEIFALQIRSALENFQLFTRLEQTRASLSAARHHALHMLAMASEFKDRETGNHVQRIEHYSRAIAERLDLSSEECGAIADASILHDLGKIGIPDIILQKPGKLTSDEWAIMRTHSALGAHILGNAPWFQLASQISMNHHEHWDGNGYPNGLHGEQIPLPARIVSVADCFDALVSRRPYKAPWSVEAALAEIEQQADKKFDPRVVGALLAVHASGRLAVIRAELGDD